MIDRERLTIFASSFERDLSPELEDMRGEAIGQGVPVIRREMQSLLRFLLCVSRPCRILEIGSGTGFSSLFMRACLLEDAGMSPAGIRIDTIEMSAERAHKAEAAIDSFKAQGQISLINADAALILPDLKGPYQFIFLDGPKGQYADYLPLLKKLLSSGGILAADNI